MQQTIKSYVKYKLIDPVKATFGVTDIRETLVQIGMSEVKNIVSEYNVSEFIAKSREVNIKLTENLEKIMSRAGLKILTCEITQIMLP